MEETPSNAADQPQQAMKKDAYSVTKIYKSAWEVVKKNFKQLAIISLIGIAFDALLSVVVVAVLYNAIVDSGSNWVTQMIITFAAAILGSVLLALVQLIAIKAATEGKSLALGPIIQRSMKFLPRTLLYGGFVILVYIAVAAVVIIGADASGSLGAILALAAFVGLIVAIFRYIFVQYLIVEEKQLGFFERFKLSERLTKRQSGTIFMMMVMAIVLAIGTGIVSSIVTSPFKEERRTSTSVTFDLDDFENDRVSLRDAVKDASDIDVDANYIIKTTIESAISAGLSLVIIAAFLELYKYRKMDEKLEL